MRRMDFMQMIADNASYRFVCPQLVNCTNIAKLTKPHNGSYEEMHSESVSPERKKWLLAMKSQNGQRSGRVALMSTNSTLAYNR